MEGNEVEVQGVCGSKGELLVQKLKVSGHQDLTLTADPLSRQYPYCIGQSLWTAAAELVDFFNSLNDDMVSGMGVLELGAGLGAVGMALARKGASEVFLTDQEVMMPLLSHNIGANFPTGSHVTAEVLRWGDQDQLEKLHAGRGFAMVVGADVAYDESEHLPLLSTIAGCLARNPLAKVVLSIPDRPESRCFLPRAADAGIGWRLLRRTAASASPDLQHDCLILELFPVSEAPRGRPPAMPHPGGCDTALVCDFDWSLVEENSDTYTLEQLGAIHFLDRLQQAGELSWTRCMDGSLLAAQRELGATEAQVRAACRRTPMDPAVASALREVASSKGVDMLILSDANSVFIQEILLANALLGGGLYQAKDIYTNPASFDSAGALRVAPYHRAPPGCPMCPDNLCKGSVLEKLLMAGRYRRLIYVGDGGNDFCPSCRTGPGDFILARTAYPNGRPGRLLAKLTSVATEEEPQDETASADMQCEVPAGASRPPHLRVPLVAGRVVPWQTAPELAARILELAVGTNKESRK